MTDLVALWATLAALLTVAELISPRRAARHSGDRRLLRVDTAFAGLYFWYDDDRHHGDDHRRRVGRRASGGSDVGKHEPDSSDRCRASLLVALGGPPVPSTR